MTGPQSFIFKAAARLLFFVANIVALYLLLRGHNLPGGGFIAGLATAISILLLSMAIGLEAMHRLMRFDPMRVAAAGLAISLLTGMAPVLFGRPFLEHFDTHLHDLPLLGDVHLGTPLAFDVGVYLVVVGIVCKILFVFGTSTQGMPALTAAEESRYSSPVERPIEEEAGPAEDADATRRPHAT